MKLEDFLQKNKIILNDKELFLSKKALEIMAKSQDIAHTDKHVLDMLDALDEFMKSEEYQKKCQNIKINNLILAICWHDVWRSTKFPETVFALFFVLTWDGMGSSWQWTRAAKKLKIPRKQRREVGYIIRKHSYFQLFPLFGVNAKLLYDLDNADIFNERRLDLLTKKIYNEKEKISFTRVRMARLGLWIIEKFSLEINFSFDWFKKDFVKRKNNFIKEVKKIIAGYEILIK